MIPQLRDNVRNGSRHERQGLNRGSAMKITNDQELENTRIKLTGLLELIKRHESETSGHPARKDSLRTIQILADQLRNEISEYEAARVLQRETA
jgi:hypothetical protein